MPLISIVVPVFNLENYISETLDSILKQTYTNFEVLVIDDHSTDNTVEIIKEYGVKDSRIKLLTNTRKKGVSGARNTGIFAAKGEWIAFLDGDDLWTDVALDVRVDCLNIYPETSFITADIACFSTDVKQAEASWVETNNDWNKCFGSALKLDTPSCIEKPIKTFLHSVTVWTGVVMIKSDLLKTLGGFDESLPAFEDIQLWMKVACHSDTLVFAPKTIAFYRQREGSLMHSAKAIHHYAPQAYMQLLKDPAFSQYKKQLKDNIRDFNLQNCFYYRKAKNYKQAFFWGLRSVYWQPFSFVAWKNLIACCLFR